LSSSPVSSQRSPVVVSQAVTAEASCLLEVLFGNNALVLVVGYRSCKCDRAYLASGTEAVLGVDSVEKTNLVLQAEESGSRVMDLPVVIYFFYIFIALALAREGTLYTRYIVCVAGLRGIDLGQHIGLGTYWKADVEAFDELAAELCPVVGDFLCCAGADGIGIAQGPAGAGVQIADHEKAGRVGDDLSASGALGVALVVGVLDCLQQFGRVFVGFVQYKCPEVGEGSFSGCLD